jgi:hypothetical protein
VAVEAPSAKHRIVIDEADDMEFGIVLDGHGQLAAGNARPINENVAATAPVP